MTFIVIISICLVLIPIICEFIFSIVGKTYNGYAHRDEFHNLSSWIFYSWNYIGARNHFERDYWPVRHIGVRWFGHEWEEIIEIPKGELRF